MRRADYTKPKRTKLFSKGSMERKLPDRAALNDLGRSQRSVMDYAKATPLDDETPSALTTMFMAKP